ncbi:response regulator [Gillisia sp. M10.2A]|uniref:Response regulator n=1 Tax=Gillisia lutea TaxID=2909668 RepID=A0ABS9EMQ4_9FLAO|nr:response regulator [Gillisia lutea]MCF4102736.1 response regulator [Gillisia lutea]
MITTALRILLVEDKVTDAELTIRMINKIALKAEVKVVDNLSACADALRSFVPDVVISDYNLPTCSGLEVLELVKSKDSTMEFIFLTGTINDEEVAANTILSGVSGFVLKKHMNTLDEKLRPLLKKIVFNMSEREEVRLKIRENKIAVNEIYDFLDSINSDNSEQKVNIKEIREKIKKDKEQDDAE